MRRVGWSWIGMVVGVVGAGLLGLALFGGMVPRADAHLGDGGGPSLIHACVATKAGAVRIVGPTGSCNATKETAAHWPAGPSGRFVDLGLVVVDRQTGLMWEKKVAGGGCLHCVNDTYNWCQATGIATGCSVSPPSWIAQVNAEAFAGFTDWRLPTGGPGGGELATILDCSFSPSPCIDPMFGPTASSYYWSATEFDPTDAWFVGFRQWRRELRQQGRTHPGHVRAVRGGP